MNAKTLTSAPHRSFKYLLGDSRKEAARLEVQSRLWDPVAHALFDRLKVRKGWKVLEVGPGRGSLHLELRRRVQGPIDAVERSPAFADALVELCERDGLGEGRIWRTDLFQAELPSNHYDLIFIRWVFLFLPNPESHLRKLKRALKPGGRLAIQDYHRDSLGMVPRAPEWENFMAADRAFFASEGGDVNIGARLPELFKKVGLELIEVRPEIKLARPGTLEWRWLSDYFLGVMERYAQFRPFTPKQASSLRRRWASLSRDKTALLIAPTLLDIVGAKPKTRA